MREMNDSGIEWIGQIPKHWEVHPVYAYFEEAKTKNYRMQEQNLLSLSYGRIIRKDINTNGGLLPASFNTYNVVEAGDIIIRPTDLQNDKRSLRTGLVKEQGIITSAYIDLRPKDNVNSKYYHYLLHSYDVIKVFYNMGNGVRQGLNFSEFAKLLLLEPTTVEQQQIADYLDTQCSEIDATAEDIQKEISLLEDYKKSLITEAVTKGLNPDAEMKDSGIEWIGKIPKGWTVKNLKYIFDITSGSTPASGVSQYWDGDIKWITPADFKTNDVYVFGGRRNITGLGLMSCSTQVIPDSSIIFSKRAPIGSVVITGEKMCINQGCLALVSKHQKTSVKFYYYALSILDKIFDMLGSGTTFKEISAFRFSNTSLQCPHFEEQQQIADYLDSKCSEIDAIIADKKRQRGILAEYKKSLIYEYVTGKKEVPVHE